MHRSFPRKPGFRLGVYVFEDAEIVDYAAPYGVFSVARRFDPELDAFLIAEALRPVQTQAGFTVLPNYAFAERPAMDALLIPGGLGTRQEMHNVRLHQFIRALPQTTLLTSDRSRRLWTTARVGSGDLSLHFVAIDTLRVFSRWFIVQQKGEAHETRSECLAGCEPDRRRRLEPERLC